MFDEDLKRENDAGEPMAQTLEDARETGEGTLQETDAGTLPENDADSFELSKDVGSGVAAEGQDTVKPLPKQTRPPEENARLDEVRQQERHTARTEFDKGIAELCLINPVTYTPITSLLDLEEYNRVKPIYDEAWQKGISYEAELSNRQREKQEILQNDPEYQNAIAERNMLRKERAEKQFAEDLAEIKRLYPSEQAKHILDLGNEFFTLCANGISPVIAYEAVKASKSKIQKPPGMGDVKATGIKEPTNKYAHMSDSDFEKEIVRAERGELSKGRY